MQKIVHICAAVSVEICRAITAIVAVSKCAQQQEKIVHVRITIAIGITSFTVRATISILTAGVTTQIASARTDTSRFCRKAAAVADAAAAARNDREAVRIDVDGLLDPSILGTGTPAIDGSEGGSTSAVVIGIIG